MSKIASGRTITRVGRDSSQEGGVKRFNTHKEPVPETLNQKSANGEVSHIRGISIHHEGSSAISPTSVDDDLYVVKSKNLDSKDTGNISNHHIRVTHSVKNRIANEDLKIHQSKDYIEYNKKLITDMSKKKDQAIASKSPKQQISNVNFCLQEDIAIGDITVNKSNPDSKQEMIEVYKKLKQGNMSSKANGNTKKTKIYKKRPLKTSLVQKKRKNMVK